MEHRYTITKELGHGSYSIVYKAKDTKTNKSIALKLIESGSKPEFEMEVNILSQLSHSNNIPKFLSCGTFDGKFSIAMELLGQSLTSKCKTHSISNLKSIVIVEQIITALQALHEIGYIHRDIKPDNIVESSKKKSKKFYLIDFGLSRGYIDLFTNHHYPQRVDRSFKGNLLFCSCNILAGIQASRRDDLISIIYVLIYLITQSLPWIGHSASVNEMIGGRLGSAEKLCKGMPSEITECLTYVQSLTYYQKPDYSYLFLRLHKLKKHVEVDILRIKEAKVARRKTRKTIEVKSSSQIYRASSVNPTIKISPPDFSVDLRNSIKNQKHY